MSDGKAASEQPEPERRSYSSFATFSDPDGNDWLLQEVALRVPGGVEADRQGLPRPLSSRAALRRAAAAGGESRGGTGMHDAALGGLVR